MIPVMIPADAVKDIPEAISKLTCLTYDLHNLLITCFLAAHIVVMGFMELHDAAHPSDAHIPMLLHHFCNKLFLYLGF